MNKERRYKRLENFYDVSRVNEVYSVIMVDIILVVLPVLAIVHSMGLLGSENDRGAYVSVLLAMFTIGCNFVAHLLASESGSIDSRWAEREMGVLNDTEKTNDAKESTTIDTACLVFKGMSYILFLASSIAFYMTL